MSAALQIKSEPRDWSDLEDWTGLGQLNGEDLVRAAIERFPGQVAVESSFGVESAVLLDIVARVDPSLPVLTVNTGCLFPQTLEYMSQLVARLGLRNLRVLRPDPKQVAELDSKGDLWSRNPDQCCAMRKVAPMRAARTEFRVLIDGRKRYHGAARTALPTAYEEEGWLKLCPLATWSQEDIDLAFHLRELPRHPLAEQGYLSLGCRPCTDVPTPGAGPRDGRWVGTNKTECGLHQARWHTDETKKA